MPVVLPKRHTDRTAIEAAAKLLQAHADRRVRRVQRAIAACMRTSREGVAHDLLERGVREHDWTLIREAIPVLAIRVPLIKADDDTPEDELQSDLVDVFTDSARFGLTLVPKFDVVDTNAVTYARTSAGKLLTDLDANALANARQAIAYGIENGLTVQQTSNYLANVLYLPERGMNAVENYFNGLIGRLEKGDSIAEAARAEGKTRALSPTKFLDAKNVDTLVDRYTDRWVDYTAETTARTMTIEASNAGLRDGWDQAAAAGYFDPADASLVWYATDDDITCPICEDLDGTDIDFDGGTFETSFGAVDYPPAHPDCRCTMVLITSTFEQEVA